MIYWEKWVKNIFHSRFKNKITSKKTTHKWLVSGAKKMKNTKTLVKTQKHKNMYFSTLSHHFCVFNIRIMSVSTLLLSYANDVQNKNSHYFVSLSPHAKFACMWWCRAARLTDRTFCAQNKLVIDIISSSSWWVTPSLRNQRWADAWRSYDLCTTLYK